MKFLFVNSYSKRHLAFWRKAFMLIIPLLTNCCFFDSYSTNTFIKHSNDSWIQAQHFHTKIHPWYLLPSSKGFLQVKERVKHFHQILMFQGGDQLWKLGNNNSEARAPQRSKHCHAAAVVNVTNGVGGSAWVLYASPCTASAEEVWRSLLLN